MLSSIKKPFFDQRKRRIVRMKVILNLKMISMILNHFLQGGYEEEKVNSKLNYI